MDLAQYIDHTYLRPECALSDIEKLCAEAVEYQFVAVCLPPYYVKDARTFLEGSKVRIATVAGFPFGYNASAAKVETIKRAIEEGADELDAVINLSALKSRHWNYVRNELESLVTACHIRGKILKAIIETGILDREEVLKVCEICAALEVDFVKTSTGFNGQGATVEAVTLIRSALPPTMKIKASGGIRELAFAEQLIQAGANRLGTSAGIHLVTSKK